MAFMYPAGELANCAVMTCLFPIARSSHPCFRSAEIARRSPHPKELNVPLNGGPQMVEISRDGKRVYFTNSLYSSWDEQIYPDGIRTWFVKANAGPDGSLTLDRDFFVTSTAHRLHQVRLDGGDASSDSFCYPS
jgi:methanethiol oxidase